MLIQLFNYTYQTILPFKHFSIWKNVPGKSHYHFSTKSSTLKKIEQFHCFRIFHQVFLVNKKTKLSKKKVNINCKERSADKKFTEKETNTKLFFEHLILSKSFNFGIICQNVLTIEKALTSEIKIYFGLRYTKICPKMPKPLLLAMLLTYFHFRFAATSPFSSLSLCIFRNSLKTKVLIGKK